MTAVNRAPRVLLAAFLLAAASAFGAVAWADGAKCTIATKGSSAPAQACAKGGRAEARTVMKAMVKRAKDKGVSFSCDGCHKDMDSFELTPNARADFKKLDAAQKK